MAYSNRLQGIIDQLGDLNEGERQQLIEYLRAQPREPIARARGGGVRVGEMEAPSVPRPVEIVGDRFAPRAAGDAPGLIEPRRIMGEAESIEHIRRRLEAYHHERKDDVLPEEPPIPPAPLRLEGDEKLCRALLEHGGSQALIRALDSI